MCEAMHNHSPYLEAYFVSLESNIFRNPSEEGSECDHIGVDTHEDDTTNPNSHDGGDTSGEQVETEINANSLWTTASVKDCCDMV